VGLLASPTRTSYVLLGHYGMRPVVWSSTSTSLRLTFFVTITASSTTSLWILISSLATGRSYTAALLHVPPRETWKPSRNWFGLIQASYIGCHSVCWATSMPTSGGRLPGSGGRWRSLGPHGRRRPSLAHPKVPSTSRTARAPGRWPRSRCPRPYTKHLPEAVVPNARDDQNAPVNHLMIHPDLLVAGVHEHVGVGLSFESTRPLQASSSESREPASCETRLFEKEVPHSSSVMSLTFLLETPSTYISMSAKQSAFSFLW
jgi:hypothetical protein